MRRFAVTVASFLLCVQPALADELKPAGTWIFQGTVALTKASTTINCSVGATLLIPDDSPDLQHGTHSHGHRVTSADISIVTGDFECGFIDIDSNPHTVALSKTSGTTFVTFEDFGATIPMSGRCFGDLETEFENAPDRLEVNTSVPDFPPGSNPCLISGTLSLVWPADVDIIL